MGNGGGYYPRGTCPQRTFVGRWPYWRKRLTYRVLCASLWLNSVGLRNLRGNVGSQSRCHSDTPIVTLSSKQGRTEHCTTNPINVNPWWKSSSKSIVVQKQLTVKAERVDNSCDAVTKLFPIRGRRNSMTHPVASRPTSWKTIGVVGMLWETSLLTHWDHNSGRVGSGSSSRNQTAQNGLTVVVPVDAGYAIWSNECCSSSASLRQLLEAWRTKKYNIIFFESYPFWW